MAIYSQQTVIALLNGIACALLAAAASAKARTYGSHFTGAILLGCLCGLACPLMRDLVLYGHPGGMAALAQYPDDSLIGSVGGIYALYLGRRLRIALWLDCLGLSLATCLGAIICSEVFGVTGGLVLGVISAVLPGFIADVALGNTATLIERDWYVTAAIVGAVLSLLVFILPHVLDALAFMKDRLMETAILSGASLAVCLQIWRGKKEI